MIPSQKCIDLIKGFESCELKPYLDSGGVPTVGWGNCYYLDGSKVKITDPPISQRAADDLFDAILSGFASQISSLVTVPINQNQFDAFCSLVYNIGVFDFKTSTLLRLLNQREFTLASQQFPLWDHVKGIVDDDLKKRRLIEQALFLS